MERYSGLELQKTTASEEPELINKIMVAAVSGIHNEFGPALYASYYDEGVIKLKIAGKDFFLVLSTKGDSPKAVLEEFRGTSPWQTKANESS